VEKPASDDDAVAYSYVLTYQIYLDEMKLDVYDQCIDDELTESPAEYCGETLTGYIELALWNDANEFTACSEGVNSLEEVCLPDEEFDTFTTDADGNLVDDETYGGDIPDECKPCAYVIAYMFERYEFYVTTTVQAAFEAIAEDQSTTLNMATYAAIGTDIDGLISEQPATQTMTLSTSSS